MSYNYTYTVKSYGGTGGDYLSSSPFNLGGLGTGTTTKSYTVS